MAFTNNRIGTVLPDAFLGDVLSMRENEVDAINSDKYFEMQRGPTTWDRIVLNEPASNDFMDSFFTKTNQEEKPDVAEDK